MKLLARLTALFDRGMDRLDPPSGGSSEDFIVDADWAIREQKARGARAVVWLTAQGLLIMLVWAAFAQLDEVTKGEGRVIPSRQVQILQSLDGGIVSEILVKEGQQVREGQLMLRLDPTRFVSNLKENRAEYLSLLAKAERLQALADGKPFLAPQPVLTEAPEIAEQERVLYESARAEAAASIGIAQQQLTQRNQELKETMARQTTAQHGLDLTQQELEKTRPLTRTGAVSDVELLRLERDVSRYRGERDMTSAQIPRIQAAIGEAQRKIQEVELSIRNKARNELSDVNSRLGRLSEGSVALEDRVKQAEIRSPVNGTVKRLQVNTLGGVVQPAKDIVEIVPSDDALLLEARVLPRDIAFLRPGQKALVKFTAYDFSIYGGLEGTLENISADSIIDEKGNAFYLVKVRTLNPTIGDQQLPIIPGMVAEVDILTGKKSILAYLMKPVLRAHANALRER